MMLNSFDNVSPILNKVEEVMEKIEKAVTSMKSLPMITQVLLVKQPAESATTQIGSFSGSDLEKNVQKAKELEEEFKNLWDVTYNTSISIQQMRDEIVNASAEVKRLGEIVRDSANNINESASVKTVSKKGVEINKNPATQVVINSKDAVAGSRLDKLDTISGWENWEKLKKFESGFTAARGKGKGVVPAAIEGSKQSFPEYKQYIDGLQRFESGFSAARGKGKGVFPAAIEGTKQAFPKYKQYIEGLQKFESGFSAARGKGKGVVPAAIEGTKQVFPEYKQYIDGLQKFQSGFRAARGSGGTNFSSIIQGAQKAMPWLNQVSGWVARFTPMWLVNAARIASGWIVALGPAGWIIAGITAIVVAAVWAWNTNFMGFKDKCIWVWNAISDWGKQTWTNISGFVSNAINLACDWIDKAKEGLGLTGKMSFYGPIKGVELNAGDQPFLSGGNRSNTNNINQTVNVNVATTNEANQFVAQLEPSGKHIDSRNPSYNF